MAISSGDMHEMQTGLDEIIHGVPWSNNPKDKSTWKDHDIDINNTLAGAKIAQSILEKGGSWADVERAIVNEIKHLGPNGRIPQPNVTLHNFLDQ
jgi:hypothetical protein